MSVRGPEPLPCPHRRVYRQLRMRCRHPRLPLGISPLASTAPRVAGLDRGRRSRPVHRRAAHRHGVAAGAQSRRQHLAAPRLDRAAGVAARTLLLSGGVALATFTVGTAAAWLVTMYRFPGREVLDRLLVLPLAVPTYIIAYCYVELFDYAGPVQTHVRARVRLHRDRRLLVPAGALAGRRHLRPDGRALSVRVPDGARELRAAVGVRARSGAHARPLAARHLRRCGAAAGAAGHCRRRRARHHGMPQRSRRRAVSRRRHAVGEHLRHLDAALEPRRRGADRRRHAGVGCWRCSPSSERRAAAHGATTRRAAIAPFRSRRSSAGKARWRPASRRCRSCSASSFR